MELNEEMWRSADEVCRELDEERDIYYEVRRAVDDPNHLLLRRWVRAGVTVMSAVTDASAAAVIGLMAARLERLEGIERALNRELTRGKDAIALIDAGDKLFDQLESGQDPTVEVVEAFHKALRSAHQTYRVPTPDVDLSSINVGAFGASAIPVPKIVREGGELEPRAQVRSKDELRREAFTVAADEDTDTTAFGSSPVPPADPKKILNAFTPTAPSVAVADDDVVVGVEFRIADFQVDVVVGAKGPMVLVEKRGAGGTVLRSNTSANAILRDLIIKLLDHIDRLEETPVAHSEAHAAVLALVQERVFQTAVAKGWWPTLPHDMEPAARSQFVLSKLALINSEVAEALELARDDNYEATFDEAKCGKPEGFGTEIADVVIRCFDLCGALGVDLGHLIMKKVEFNETRKHRHGGRLA